MRYRHTINTFKNFSRRLLAVTGSLLVLSPTFLSGSVAAASSTVTITGNTSTGENQPGWLFNRDASTSTPYEFNTDQASIGTGSLYVPPISATPSNKFIAENFLPTAERPIANLDSIHYDFLIGSGGTAGDAAHFYMSVYANFGSTSTANPNNFYDCRYNVIPVVGSTAAFTTVTFDPTASYSVTTRGTSPHVCPTSPAGMNLLSAGSTIRAFSLNVGDTSASDTGLDGYLDKVVFATNTDTVTYDFEPTVVTPPTPPPVTPTDPSGGSGAGTSTTAAATVTPTVLTPFFQNFAASFNDDGTVSAAAIPESDAGTGDVLGTEDSSTDNSGQDAADSPKTSGLTWYWLLTGLAGLGLLGWLMAAAKRRKDNKDA